MRIEQSTLEQGSPTQVSTGKSETASPANQPSDPTKRLEFQYNQRQFCLNRAENERAYTRHGIDYVTPHNWTVVATPKMALDERLNGIRALTLREADFLARQQTNVNDPTFVAAIMDPVFCGYVLEDSVELRDIWFLRDRYNRGLDWKHNKRDTLPEADQQAGDEQIMSILREMEVKRLPPWPHELEHGFPVELTKPEWMTWEQYTKARLSLTR